MGARGIETLWGCLRKTRSSVTEGAVDFLLIRWVLRMLWKVSQGRGLTCMCFLDQSGDRV